LLDDWRAAFKRAWAYLTNSGNHAKNKLFARTMSGRIRHFTIPDWEKCKEIAIERAIADGKDPKKIDLTKATSRVYYGQFGSIEREGKNTPIQGTNADIIKLAMGMLRPKLKQFDAFLVNTVYDELDLEVRYGQEQDVVALVSECYRLAAAQFMKKVVMESEAQISDRWTK
jgi:DNA polymerase I-like protein with 3'-5' exonuclease and polymerase domains